ncbi:MAG: right-handed parallel beta-helix repeat-containing protein [Candidatus Hydrogenedentes bacterium]|nr:right-handed parallel beta-helix repeat-containing protein [Candidatus Hydrogenedentota bacterium]
MFKANRVHLAALVFAACLTVFAQETRIPPVGPNPQAIAEIASGARTVANASWWGFNAEDATDALQAAIDSPAKTVIVPYMGAPWIVRPIRLRGGLELVFDPGVLVLAKRGEFQGGGDSLFDAADAENITIRGYGATLRMWKKDYQNPPYKKAEWRMCIAINGCKNVLIEGVRLESSGGDGFYIGATKGHPWCEDITIRNCVAKDHHRQGISVISAQNLLVENCEFSGTSGTAPQAGIDFEPNGPDERLVNCVVRNCVFQDNAGAAMQVYLKPLDSTSQPVSIRFENCVGRLGPAGASADDIRATGVKGHAGILVGAIRDDGPRGVVEFVNCVVENIGREAVSVYDKSATTAQVRFERCSWKSSWLAVAPDEAAGRAPLAIQRNRPSVAAIVGGIEFTDCVLHDDIDRPALRVYGADDDHGVSRVSGVIWRSGPHTARADLGPNPKDSTLAVLALK